MNYYDYEDSGFFEKKASSGEFDFERKKHQNMRKIRSSVPLGFAVVGGFLGGKELGRATGERAYDKNLTTTQDHLQEMLLSQKMGNRFNITKDPKTSHYQVVPIEKAITKQYQEVSAVKEKGPEIHIPSIFMGALYAGVLSHFVGYKMIKRLERSRGRQKILEPIAEHMVHAEQFMSQTFHDTKTAVTETYQTYKEKFKGLGLNK